MEVNPFESPQPFQPQVLPGRQPFLPPRTLVVPLLYVGAVSSVLFAIAAFMQYLLLGRIAEGNYTEDEVTWNDLLVGLVALFYLLVLLVTIVLWCNWKLRAARNLRAFGGEFEFTPGWAVGWYFVPIANLFKPYQAMREIFESSVPRTAESSLASTPSTIVGIWWGLWIAGNILGQVSFRLPDDTVDMLRIGSLVSIVESALHVAVCLAAVKMIRLINANQLKRAQQLESIPA